MNEIFVFHGQEVRTVTINNEPWFVGKDVAQILGYTEPHKAIARHVDSDDGIFQSTHPCRVRQEPGYKQKRWHHFNPRTRVGCDI